MKLILKSFLTPKLLQEMEKQKLLFIEKVPNYPCHSRQIYLNDITIQTCIVQNKFLQTLIEEFTELKRSFQQQIIHKNLLKVSSVTFNMIKQKVLKMITLFHQDFLLQLSPLLLQQSLFVLRMRFLQNNLCESFITLQEVNLTYRLNG